MKIVTLKKNRRNKWKKHFPLVFKVKVLKVRNRFQSSLKFPRIGRFYANVCHDLICGIWYVQSATTLEFLKYYRFQRKEVFKFSGKFMMSVKQHLSLKKFPHKIYHSNLKGVNQDLSHYKNWQFRQLVQCLDLFSPRENKIFRHPDLIHQSKKVPASLTNQKKSRKTPERKVQKNLIKTPKILLNNVLEKTPKRARKTVPQTPSSPVEILTKTPKRAYQCFAKTPTHKNNQLIVPETPQRVFTQSGRESKTPMKFQRCQQDFESIASHSKPKKRKLDPCICREKNCKKQKTNEQQELKVTIHRLISPFVCVICLRNFCSKRALKDHRPVHMKNRPKFACRFCKKQFLIEDSANRHESKCTGSLDKKRGPKNHKKYCRFCFREKKSKSKSSVRKLVY